MLDFFDFFFFWINSHSDNRPASCFWAFLFIIYLFLLRWPVVQLASRKTHQEKTLPLHEAPDPRTGKGIPLQHVSPPGSQIRGGQTAAFDRETGENLVSEPQDEDEERE